MFALAGFALFYVCFGVYLTVFQERVVYFPDNRAFNNCPALADATIVVASGTRMYAKLQDGQPTAVLYHGNAGSACDRAFYTQLFTKAGYGYVLVEYAGYSNDPVPPTHARVRQDVRNVAAWLAEQGVADVAVVGESIGTGAASYHAEIAPPSALLLIAPFTDLHAVARTRFWFYPTSLLVDNAFDNVAALAQYTGRTHLIHGTDDTIIPYPLGRALAATLSPAATFHTIEGAGHNNLFGFSATYTAIEQFLQGE